MLNVMSYILSNDLLLLSTTFDFVQFIYFKYFITSVFLLSVYCVARVEKLVTT